MLRRSFLGAVGLGLASLAGCKVSGNSSIKLKSPVVGDGYGLDYDPFIKIYTKKGFFTKYEAHRFFQSNTDISYHKEIDGVIIPNTGCWIPLETKNNQKNKDDMIKAVKKGWKNKDITYFEIIADNGKPNLFAIGAGV